MNISEGKLTYANLKLIALVTMLVDHFFAVVYKSAWGSGDLYDIGRNIGRIAFPIFAYMIAEGMRRSSSRTKYLLRLFVFAILSEIPFDFAISGELMNQSSQNVYFTLLIGALCIYIIAERRHILYPLILILMISAQIMHTDYGTAGVFLIIAFYLAGASKLRITLAIPAFLVVYATIGIFRYYSVDHFRVFSIFLENEFFAVLAIPLILMYNGAKGRPLNKWFYYAFYPVHLLILGLMK